MSDPKTLAEWQQYIAVLEGDALSHKVKAANSIAFIQALQEDGLGPKDIHAVFEAFVRRLVACRELPPAGGYYDLRRMMSELGLS